MNKLSTILPRNIGYHLSFWLAYFLMYSARDLVYYPNFWSNFVLNLVLHLVLVPMVYINLFGLVPRLMWKQRYGQYILGLLALILIFTVIDATIYGYIFGSYFEAHEKAAFFTSPEGYMVVSMEVLLLLVLSMALFFIQQYYVKERYTQELERKNLKSELELLKHQIQPHFFFNTLNTVYMLMERNSDLAKNTLLQFSDIISHQLYDANKSYISLQKEIEYLRNYIEVEQVRHADFLELTCSLPKHAGPWQIAPMILIVFVENAFKHSRSAAGYWVHIDLKLMGNKLSLKVENSRVEKTKSKIVQKGGIGLNNVKRRLALLYPEKHELKITPEEDRYLIELLLDLSPLEQQDQSIKIAKSIPSL